MNTRRQLIHKAIALTVFCLTLLIPQQTAYASVFNIADGDVPGLIAAINAANANVGPDTINLAHGGMYTLTYIAGPDSWHGPTGLPIVQGFSETQRESLTINGNGSTIRRSDAPGIPEFRIFHALYANVILDSVVIKGGRGYGSRCGGGGLYLNVSNTVIRNSTITDNFGVEGGGICNNNASTLTIENSTISHNTGYGGRTGGGILNEVASVSISNSTLFENRADGSPGFEGRGDAIADAFSTPGSIVIKNSIIASPTRGLGSDCVFFTPVSLGHNIFSDTTCGQNVAGGDLIVPNLTLGPLANNGGVTSTHALLDGSPSIDAIPLADCTTIAGLRVVTDQRGINRPSGGRCDIGSFEYGGLAADAVLDFSIHANPTGAWSYGYKTLMGRTFVPYDYLSVIPGLPVDIWRSVGSPQPLILKNNSNGVVTTQTVILTPDLLMLHPGPNGERSVLRWTAPASGTYQFEGRFQGLDNGSGTTTDVAITYNSVTNLFAENVNGYGVQKPFVFSQTVMIGDTIDFSVGYGGNNRYESDSTGLTVSVSPTTDATPPIITPSVTGILGNAGWYTSDVEVSWSVTDPESSVSTSTGCETATVTSDTSGVTFTCSATSAGGTSSQSITVNRDATAPEISCGSADVAWHASDVSILCTATDNASQLASESDANFSLVTNVAPGTETVNAATDSRAVCDNAGNCATASPISGNKVDKKAPTIAIAVPTNSVYLLKQNVTASFTCQDVGSGVASCDGSAPNGSNIDTISVGTKTFTVSSADNAGNAAVPQSVSYTVSFGISVLYDETRAVKSGSTIPIKLQLVDALGYNMSSASVIVYAVSLVQIATTASEMINDAGSSNPETNFRFDSALGSSGGYIFNLKTTGLSTGTYRLGFTVGVDPTVYTVRFAVRQ